MTQQDLIARLATINLMTGGTIAPTWKVVLAKIFGSKDVNVVAGIQYTYYHWLGHTYCTDVRSV